MPEVTPDYKAIINRMKTGTADLSDYSLVHEILHKRPIATLITDEDADWLIRCGLSLDRDERMAAWRLTRTIAGAPKIREHMRACWKRDDLTDQERNVLLWRLLDDLELPASFHRSIWDWISRNKVSFMDALMEHLSPALQNGTHFDEIMRESLRDQRNPHSKHWIYLAAAVFRADDGRSNLEEIKQLLQLTGAALSDSILREIVGEIGRVLLSYEHREKAHRKAGAEGHRGVHAPCPTEAEGERGTS